MMAKFPRKQRNHDRFTLQLRDSFSFANASDHGSTNAAKPVAPNANFSHKRDCRILLSFPPDPLQLKEPYKMSYKKNDVLPHEPTRCNNMRQREITKQVNISVVRRRTRILDAKIAVVPQKDIQRWRSQHDKDSVLKYADSVQPLRAYRGMQTF